MRDLPAQNARIKTTANSGRQLSLSAASTAGYKRLSKCVLIAADRCPPAENPSNSDLVRIDTVLRGVDADEPHCPLRIFAGHWGFRIHLTFDTAHPAAAPIAERGTSGTHTWSPLTSTSHRPSCLRDRSRGRNSHRFRFSRFISENRKWLSTNGMRRTFSNILSDSRAFRERRDSEFAEHHLVSFLSLY